MARPTKNRGRDKQRMGKSASHRLPKKIAGKARAKAAANGRGRHAKAATARPAAKAKRSSAQRAHSIVLPPGYRPTESEPFMNERHKIYFRNKLVAWKEEIVRQNRATLHVLHEDSAQHADIADRATSETDRALELRARDRQRKLIAKIDAALGRIEDGSYGYCEETGEPIGLKRLDARPIATLSLEAQERHERREKVFRED
jgi:DnaK suppressor protein